MLENYVTDMLRLCAAGNVKYPERLPRFADIDPVVSPFSGRSKKTGTDILLELLNG
ncbi:MAG: hypothetical protein FWD23_17445 [Oscillospiraceae bacterium]|nr:hypothetical protein [Oscillospiraceae bacterium]